MGAHIQAHASHRHFPSCISPSVVHHQPSAYTHTHIRAHAHTHKRDTQTLFVCQSLFPSSSESVGSCAHAQVDSHCLTCPYVCMLLSAWVALSSDMKLLCCFDMHDIYIHKTYSQNKRTYGHTCMCACKEENSYSAPMPRQTVVHLNTCSRKQAPKFNARTSARSRKSHTRLHTHAYTLLCA